MANTENFITGAGAGRTSAAAWMHLAHARGGPGRAGARALLARFGLPESILGASRAALCEVVAPHHADALLAPPDADARALAGRTLAWLEAPGHHLLTLADEAYPQALLTVADPPLLLYALGRPALLQGPAVAVVGSRNASRQGLQHAEQFSEGLSQAGMPVVSGLALGIDSAAHTGGLRGAGATVAVIGTGIDIAYPARNRELAGRIAREGCIVSEYPLGMPPLAMNFPRRNRIISGMSRAVLVVEAALRSGSLITARVAADQGRDVLAIPGSIHSPLSKGCHALIKQGAKLVESLQDVLEELDCRVGSGDGRDGGNAGSGKGAQAGLFDAATVTDAGSLLHGMGYDPVTLDQLALRSGRGAALLQQELLMLELDGSVELLPGGDYRRIA
ncbi:DNA-protecting protein DprA [Oxalobacteraceae bacterium CAVE-383]|nr:DNA-protecting protein DprA [Oxalobacteraceae bacterium CAVE-383]